MFLILFLFQVWFQNRRARLRRQKKKNQCTEFGKSPSYEESSPSSSMSSSPSSSEPPSPQLCPWATYTPPPTPAIEMVIPTVPTPPSSPCKESCCSPPTICFESFAFDDLSSRSFLPTSICSFYDTLSPIEVPYLECSY
jgi:hypothetical protein